MATAKKQTRDCEDFESALSWGLNSLVEKLDDDLNDIAGDGSGSPESWANHYDGIALGLRAAATIAEKLSEMNKVLPTKEEE